MTHIGDYVCVDELVSLAGVKNSYGIQCGILVNDVASSIILIPKLPTSIQNYPNQWDPEIVGLLHFCGTNKGQTKQVTEQTLHSKLNKSVNDGVHPINVYIRYPDKRYRFMGEFARVPKYDEWIELDGKRVIVFGLMSKNIKETEAIIKEMMVAK